MSGWQRSCGNDEPHTSHTFWTAHVMGDEAWECPGVDEPAHTLALTDLLALSWAITRDSHCSHLGADIRALIPADILATQPTVQDHADGSGA